jgi:hypothetical protein
MYNYFAGEAEFLCVFYRVDFSGCGCWKETKSHRSHLPTSVTSSMVFLQSMSIGNIYFRLLPLRVF